MASDCGGTFCGVSCLDCFAKIAQIACLIIFVILAISIPVSGPVAYLVLPLTYIFWGLCLLLASSITSMANELRLELWGVPVTATIIDSEVYVRGCCRRTRYKLTLRYRTDKMHPNHFIIWKKCIVFADAAADEINTDTITLTVLPHNPKLAKAEFIPRRRVGVLLLDTVVLLFFVYLYVKEMRLTFEIIRFIMGVSFLVNVFLVGLVHVSVWTILLWWFWAQLRDDWEEEDDRAQHLLV